MIASEVRRAGPYTGNGATTVFAFAFKVFTAADVLVVQEVAGVETELVLTTDYTVNLNGDQDNDPGGSITMLAAPSSAKKLTLLSQVAYTQSLQVTNGGGFYPRVFNDAFDRAVMLIQQLAERLDRTLVAPASDGTSGLTLPTADDRAGKIAGYDDDGNPVALGGLVDAEALAAAVTTTSAAAVSATASAAAATTQATAAAASATAAAASAAAAIVGEAFGVSDIYPGGASAAIRAITVGSDGGVLSNLDAGLGNAGALVGRANVTVLGNVVPGTTPGRLTAVETALLHDANLTTWFDARDAKVDGSANVLTVTSRMLRANAVEQQGIPPAGDASDTGLLITSAFDSAKAVRAGRDAGGATINAAGHRTFYGNSSTVIHGSGTTVGSFIISVLTAAQIDGSVTRFFLTTAGTTTGIGFGFAPDGALRFLDTHAHVALAGAAGNVVAGELHLYELLWDGAVASFYKDGVLVTSGAVALAAIESRVIQIGSLPTGGGDTGALTQDWESIWLGVYSTDLHDKIKACVRARHPGMTIA